MSPALRLRAVALRAQTPAGPYGCRVDFAPGLFIIRAANTSGKSTLVRSIAYALGLEGMWGPKHDVPLPHAMTHELDTLTGPIPVLSSEVILECENGAGEAMTVRRSIVGEPNRALITAWSGRLLTSPGDYPHQDYFVRQQGAATRAAGFHRHLAEFIGWDLPLVPRVSGDEVPLYMECIVPLMFVEQKHGWSSVQGRFPSYFGLREVGRRATEFLLALEVGEIERKRRALRDQEIQIRERWSSALARAEGLAHVVSGIADGIPKQPVAAWPPPTLPRVLVPQEREWVPLSASLGAALDELERLEAEEVPTVGDAAPHLQEQLRRREEALAHAESTARAALNDAELERAELTALRQRLAGVNEELQRAKDAEKLLQLGASQALSASHGECPTCGQPVSDVLLPDSASVVSMSIGENVAYLEDQRNLVLAMQAASERRSREHEKNLESLRARLEDLRADVRALRTSLASDNRTPSLASVEARVRLRARVEQLRRVREDFELHTAAFATLAGEWSAMLAERANLPDADFSPRDEAKLSTLESTFKACVKRFGFTSVPHESLHLARDTYRPVHAGGFELDFDLSASDGVRVIWAYLLGLLEVARSQPTNHLGLLIFDEPKQQSAHGESLRQLLIAAGAAKRASQQVIVATSEDASSLEAFVSDVPHTLYSFPGRVLMPLDRPARR